MKKSVQYGLPLSAICLAALLFFSSCGEEQYKKVEGGAQSDSNTAPNKVSGLPDDSGADPSVAAIDGGKGFATIADSLGFTTNTSFEVYGDPKAQKGGSISMALVEYPATLRTEGKDSRSQVISIIGGMVYESLLGLDAKSLEYIPSLASHWKISEDKMTYSFRIDPNARWSDGKPVVADDVVATWKLLMDEGIEDPSNQGTYGQFEQPVAKSKYIVEVKCKTENWRNFLYFAGSMKIFPAHYLNKIDGKGYLEKYQYDMLPGTGPYILDPKLTRKPEFLAITRRTNYWAEKYPANVGTYNFDTIKFVFVLDDRAKIERFKAGDFDIYEPSRAQWWVEELNAEKNPNIARGLIQKNKIFNYKPLGTSGLAFNTLEEPFNDIKVREAFQYLWNIDELIDKLFYREYVRCVSYYQNSVYENKHNPKPTYNPEKAMKLLSEAGWNKKAGEKWLTKNGKPFSITLEIQEGSDRIYTPLQQDLEKVGIQLDLKVTPPQTLFQNMMKRKFKISSINWTGLFFPNPETSMHSKYAKQPETNNISGISDPKIDALCAQYDKSYDVAERIRIIQQIDSIAVLGRYTAFGWVAPYSTRSVYWNKFSQPAWGLSYTGDFDGILGLWWVDKEKEAMLNKAKKDPSLKMPIQPQDMDYWHTQKK